MGGPFLEASAWLGEACMIGAAITDGTRPAGGQLHPVTMHWRLPDGAIGWVRLVEGERVEARATSRMLTISCSGNATFQVHAPGLTGSEVDRALWRLPGLDVGVEAAGSEFAAQPLDEDLMVSYRGAGRLVLRV